MVMNTNIAAQNGASLLAESSRLLSRSLARLSSGSKLVSPGDDPAGLAVSTRFDAQINRTQAAISNVGNSISFSQTQDGFLKQIGKALNRMSELSVLAQDVTKTNSDRGLYNTEFQTLAAHVNELATKDFNGVSLFSGTALNVTTDANGGTLRTEGVTASYLSTTAAVPYAASTTLGTLIPSFTDDTIKGQGPGPGSIAIGFTSGDAGSTLTSLASYIAMTAGTGGSASYDAQTGVFSVTVGAGRNLTETGTNSILTALGLHPLDNSAGASAVTMTSTLTTTSPASSLDISTASGAVSALTTLKSAITQLASDRATIGANISVLSASADQLGTLKGNLSAANSRIADVDVAEESTQFARYNILVQAGTAMLSQANSSQQSVLRLLG